MDNEAFFQQFKRNIEVLLSQGKFEEALEKCQLALQKFPNEKSLLKIKRDIETQITHKNEKEIKANIKAAKNLFDQGGTEQALKLIKDTFPLAPNNEKLKDLYREFQEAYKEKLEEAEKSFIKNSTNL